MHMKLATYSSEAGALIRNDTILALRAMVKCYNLILGTVAPSKIYSDITRQILQLETLMDKNANFYL
jgi:hypothetical protein